MCVCGIFVLLVGDLLFQTAFKCNAEGLSSVPKCKRAALRLMEKIHVRDKRPSGMSYRAVGCEFNVNEPTIYIK